MRAKQKSSQRSGAPSLRGFSPSLLMACLLQKSTDPGPQGSRAEYAPGGLPPLKSADLGPQGT